MLLGAAIELLNRMQEYCTVNAFNVLRHCGACHCDRFQCAETQAPCADLLARLQALLGLGQLPGRVFLSFLLLVALAPHSSSNGGAAKPADAKRRRLSTNAAAPAAAGTASDDGISALWGRAVALLDCSASR